VPQAKIEGIAADLSKPDRRMLETAQAVRS
jgi:hypothetical protein